LSSSGYGGFTGTSMSAPHVSGVAGLMLSTGIEHRDVRGTLHRTSMDLGSEGFDPYFGHGLVNANWAVNNVDEIKVLVGERQGDEIETVLETSLDLEEKSYSLTGVPAGNHRVYGWIDVQGTGTIDPGDYLAKTGEIEFSADGEYVFDLVLKEYDGTGFSGD